MTDVDSTIQIDNPLINAALAEYRKNAEKVEEIDEKLGDSGAGALSRAAVENYDNKDAVTNTVTNLVADVAGADLLAVDVLIRRVLRSVAGQVKEYVEANKTEAPELSEDEQKSLRADRKAAVDAANTMRNAVTATSPQWAEANLDSVMPALVNKKGAGPGGTRAPRLKGNFSWTVDGDFVSEKIGDVAKDIGIPGHELKAAMVSTYAQKAQDAGKDFDAEAWFKDPPERIEFVLVVGEGEKENRFRVVGKMKSSDTGDESDDEDDSFDEEDTTSETTDEGDDLFN